MNRSIRARSALSLVSAFALLGCESGDEAGARDWAPVAAGEYARIYDNGQADQGRVYVYLGAAAGLAATEAWTAKSDRAYAYFGVSVTSEGDVNADGYDDLLIGAPFLDNGHAWEGWAYLYAGRPLRHGRRRKRQLVRLRRLRLRDLPGPGRAGSGRRRPGQRRRGCLLRRFRRRRPRHRGGGGRVVDGLHDGGGRARRGRQLPRRRQPDPGRQ